MKARGVNDAPKMMRGFPVRSHLHVAGDWISDNVWIAHRDLALFGRLQDILPRLPGVYDLADGKPVWMRETKLAANVTEMLAWDLEPCVIGERPAEQLFDLAHSLPPQEVWWIVAESGTYAFDGRIASATYRADIEWGMHARGFATVKRTPVLVGTSAGQRVFALAATSAGDR